MEKWGKEERKGDVNKPRNKEEKKKMKKDSDWGR